MAQTASRDASHGGRGDPGKWDRCPRSAVGPEADISHPQAVSALPQKAAINRRAGHVRLVPIVLRK
jgi:hypothetical protein